MSPIVHQCTNDDSLKAETDLDSNFELVDDDLDKILKLETDVREIETFDEIEKNAGLESSSDLDVLGPDENIEDFADQKTTTESDNVIEKLATDKSAIFGNKTQTTLPMYPSLNEMKSKITNGTFEWSKTARSILFLKKHKCASSTLREALRNYLYWRGLTEEISIFQALGQGSTDHNKSVVGSCRTSCSVARTMQKFNFSGRTRTNENCQNWDQLGPNDPQTNSSVDPCTRWLLSIALGPKMSPSNGTQIACSKYLISSPLEPRRTTAAYVF